MHYSQYNRRFPYQHTLWHATSGPEPPPSEPPDSCKVDFAIVGGGIAGVSAALTLRQAGADVALFEATTAGAGATGRSAGFVVPSFSAIRPGALQRGSEVQQRLLAAAARSADSLFSLAQQHGVDTGGGQEGWFHPAHNAKALDRIGEDAEVWQAVGGKMTLLDADRTAELTGLHGYTGSLLAASGGTVQPVRLLYGLIRSAMSMGCRYYPQTPVEALEPSGQGWKLLSHRGTLLADRVLICTNARSPNLSTALEASVIPLAVCQIATHPLAESVRGRLLGQGQSLSDTRLNLFSYRFDAQWRLITGAMPVLPIGSGKRLASRMAIRLARQLDLATVPKIEHMWFGQASVTTDRLPAINEIAPKVFSLTACNGRGLALSTIIAQQLALALTRERYDELPVTLNVARPVKHRQLQVLGARLYPAYAQLRDTLGL